MFLYLEVKIFFSENSFIVVYPFPNERFFTPSDDMLRNFPIHRPRKGDHIFMVSFEKFPVDSHLSIVVSFFLCDGDEFDKIEVSMAILRKKDYLIEIIVSISVCTSFP